MTNSPPELRKYVPIGSFKGWDVSSANQLLYSLVNSIRLKCIPIFEREGYKLRRYKHPAQRKDGKLTTRVTLYIYKSDDLPNESGYIEPVAKKTIGLVIDGIPGPYEEIEKEVVEFYHGVVEFPISLIHPPHFTLLGGAICIIIILVATILFIVFWKY